jgi:hypothetical protein
VTKIKIGTATLPTGAGMVQLIKSMGCIEILRGENYVIFMEIMVGYLLNPYNRRAASA